MSIDGYIDTATDQRLVLHARWTSRAMRCSTPRRRAQTAVDF